MTPDLAALQSLWRQRERVVLLQTGFGHGDVFLRTWQAWREDAQRRAQLHFIVIEPSPPSAEMLRLAHPQGTLATRAAELAALWPPPTRNLHLMAFEQGRVQLLLAVGEVMDVLPELQAQVDAFLIDGVDLSADPRQGTQRLCKALARLAASEASLSISVPMHELHIPLRSAGFLVLEPPLAQASSGDGSAPGTESTSTSTAIATSTSTFASTSTLSSISAAPTASLEIRAVYRPQFLPRRRGASSAPSTERHALIVGAGLAGCAVAFALAEQGWRSTLIDRHAAPAQEGSGNPAGLFHGIVNAQDGAHARFNRAAALQTQDAVRQAIDSHGARGGRLGLLRLETSGKEVTAMRAELAALQLPGDYVQALDAAEASRRCGLPLQHPAWFYPGGGWVDPAALARSFLARAGSATCFRGALAVQTLRRIDAHWQLLDAAGKVIDEAATVVLANAADALRLLHAEHWPVQRVRGQISLYANPAAPPGAQMRLPLVPLAGAGYLLPPIDGGALFGASSHAGDDEPESRDADHRANLERLQRLSPNTLPVAHVPQDALQNKLQNSGFDGRLQPGLLSGKVGWRCVANDRLPLIGAVPDEAAVAAGTVERVRDLPRQPGLYVFSALASRGITWAALGGQVLAASISGAPVPLEASLVDAVDPARFALRTKRRKAALPKAEPGD